MPLICRPAYGLRHLKFCLTFIFFPIKVFFQICIYEILENEFAILELFLIISVSFKKYW